MAYVEFPIEFQSDVPNLSPEFQEEAEQRLLELTEDRKDMTGAAIAVRAPAQREAPFVYQVRIVVYKRPADVVAIKESDTAEGALKGALDAIERQIRELRDKLDEPWKRQDIPGTPAEGAPDTEDLG